MEEEARENGQKVEAEAAKDLRRLAVGVRFRRAGNIYTFVTEDATLKRGDKVVVEAEGGVSYGTVAKPPQDGDEGELPKNVKRLLRKFTSEDEEKAAGQREKALECFETCRERILARQLPMKLVDVDIAEDGKKAIFVFFAENRVDFRTLVKDLAGLLRMRIEMRQIGSRDESKVLGCLGPCGLTTCCSTHLKQFKSISIAMAKHQGLAPNPAKLTGMCGKLKCCLDYEKQVYDECRKGLPKSGAAVETPKGEGKVIGHNVLRRECIVKLYGGGEARMPCDDCRKLTQQEREAAIDKARQAREEGQRRSQRKQRRGRDGRRQRGKDGGKG